MERNKLEERFLNDPAFHKAVDAFEIILGDGLLTPTELRDAVFLAAIRYDLRNPKPLIIDAEKWMARMGVETK